MGSLFRYALTAMRHTDFHPYPNRSAELTAEALCRSRDKLGIYDKGEGAFLFFINRGHVDDPSEDVLVLKN
jgi:hypothetical protein